MMVIVEREPRVAKCTSETLAPRARLRTRSISLRSRSKYIEMNLPKNHPSVSENAPPCPYLSAFPGEANRRISSLGPANGGRVPRVLSWSVFLNVVAIGLVIPMLPSLTQSMGGGPIHLGLVGTIYGTMQLIGSNTFGPLSDSVGRASVLKASFAGGAIGYSLVFVSMRYESLHLLLFSRIPIGVLMQTMTMARSIVSDCSEPADRTRELARHVGVPAGSGFIVGPMVGGILSVWRPQAPPLLAACFFCLAYVLTSLFLEETAPAVRLRQSTSAKDGEKKVPEKAPESDRERSIWSTISTILSKHVVAKYIFVSRFAVILGYLMMQSSFHMFAHGRYGLEPREIGYVLMYCGIVSVVVDFFVIPMLHRRTSDTTTRHREERIVVSASASFLGVALLAMALSRTLTSFLIAIVPLATGSTLFKQNVMSMLTKCVPPEEVGSITGIANAFDSVGRIVAPLLSGALMEWFGVSAPMTAGAVACAFGAFVFQIIPLDPVSPATKRKAE